MKTEKLIPELAIAFDETSKDLLQTVSSFTEKEFNKIPNDGSWSAAQVADHVRKSLKGAVNALLGNVKPTQREPDQHVEKLKSVFLNFDLKMQSPEFILPSEKPLQKDIVYEDLKEVTDAISKATNTLDLSFTSTIPFPKSGELTRYEWISFATFHTQRHIRQMKNIKKHLDAATVQ
ncbi:MAG: DinB family protein [Ginsengibacter sp.]